MKRFGKKQYEIRVAGKHLFDVDRILLKHNLWRFVDSDDMVVGLHRDWNYIRLTARPARIARVAEELNGVSRLVQIG